MCLRAWQEEQLQQLAEDEERAEIEKILVDENIQLLDDDELSSLTYLDALTGCDPTRLRGQ